MLNISLQGIYVSIDKHPLYKKTSLALCKCITVSIMSRVSPIESIEHCINVLPYKSVPSCGKLGRNFVKTDDTSTAA